MSAMINSFHTSFVQQISAAMRSLVVRYTKQKESALPEKSGAKRFVGRRAPISIVALREIDRLELAIRQGSANA